MAEIWRPGTEPLTLADVAAALVEHPVLVVHFWARWNGVDRLFAPVLDSVRAEFAGRVAFRSADVDDERLAALCEECGVVDVPALACFAGGRLVKTIVGSRPPNVLRSEFAALLLEPNRQNPTDAARMRLPLIGSVGGESPRAWLLAPIVWPMLFVGFIVAGVISIPYFMLYPDFHAHEWDRGTERQKEVMYRYRRLTAQIGFWRRCGRALAFPFRRKRPER